MKSVTVSNPLQTYTYSLTKPCGRHFDPEFKPQLTPKEMLTLGIFGGAYFADTGIAEFPKSWFAQAQMSETRDKKLNQFRVHASQSREEWACKGWIHVDDPLGWFQWYCRYYLGRRIPGEDTRQIRRWKNMQRHAFQVVKYCRKGDRTCRPVQRQALLHWAYDSRVL
jgi:hypothetical protein